MMPIRSHDISSGAELLVLGWAAIDVVQCAGQDRECGFGGSAANVAVDALQLGVKAGLYTSLGDDTYGQDYYKYLSQGGVDVSFVKILKGATPICLMWPDKCKYEWNPGIAESITFSGISDLQLQHFRWLHVGQAPKDLTLKIGELSSTRPISFNPGYALANKIYSPDTCFLFPWEILFMNKSEAELIEASLGAEIEELFRQSNVSSCIITNGPDDVILLTRREKHILPTYPSRVIDPRGAGDMLIAGTIAALLHGSALLDSLMIGIAASSIVVEDEDCQCEEINQDELMARVGRISDLASHRMNRSRKDT